MKVFIRLLLAGLIFTASQGVMRADAGYSFSFTVAQSHGNGSKKEYTYETIKNQKWSYKVTMENKSFKDVSDIEIKYVMFSKQQDLEEVTVIGGQQQLGRTTGTTTIKLLKNNDSVTFSTNEVMLQNISSAYCDDFGGAKGALRGIWIRVYVGGQMVSEFTDPQNLASKQTFDPPPKE